MSDQSTRVTNTSNEHEYWNVHASKNESRVLYTNTHISTRVSNIEGNLRWEYFSIDYSIVHVYRLCAIL